MRRSRLPSLLSVLLVACSAGAAPQSPPAGAAAPGSALSAEVAAAVDVLASVGVGGWGEAQDRAVEVVVESADARLAWLVADLLRIRSDHRGWVRLREAARALLGEPDARGWLSISNELIERDLPAPPGYLSAKRKVYSSIEPKWRRLFVDGDIDWRHVTWGGVRIDDRPFQRTDEPCNCIPAADDPPVRSAAETTWLADDAVVFGVVLGGEARAYPRRIMEVREMVNDELGGRRIGMPYCTLCASAQVFLTDINGVGEPPLVLRTSGLLSRSNKIMFDLHSYSVIDTFRGRAQTGPLAERGVVLEQVGVVTTTWGAWRRAHPDTTVLVEQLALGRDFDFRNGRDRNGPIFPVGAVDSRLPVQADVLGALDANGNAVAFVVAAARRALARGEAVRLAGVHVRLDGDGLRAVDADGVDLAAHQAFWFAWSQFYPDTQLWSE